MDRRINSIGTQPIGNVGSNPTPSTIYQIIVPRKSNKRWGRENRKNMPQSLCGKVWMGVRSLVAVQT